jgi:hypothetical protein
VRLSRPCYDKPHRCPGWAGGGTLYPKGDSRCDNGHIRTWSEDTDNGMLPFWHLRFLPCDTCDVVTLPYALRWLDWRWLRWEIRSKVADWRHERSWR